jgi:hypothetical protein
MSLWGWIAAVLGYLVLSGVTAVLVGRRLKAVRRSTKAVSTPERPREDWTEGHALRALADRLHAVEIELGRVDGIATKALRTSRSAIGTIGQAVRQANEEDFDNEPTEVPRGPRVLRGMNEG